MARDNRHKASHADVARPTFTRKMVGKILKTFYRRFMPEAYQDYRNPKREARRAAGWPSGRQWRITRKSVRRREREFA